MRSNFKTPDVVYLSGILNRFAGAGKELSVVAVAGRGGDQSARKLVEAGLRLLVGSAFEPVPLRGLRVQVVCRRREAGKPAEAAVAVGSW